MRIFNWEWIEKEAKKQAEWLHTQIVDDADYFLAVYHHLLQPETPQSIPPVVANSVSRQAATIYDARVTMLAREYQKRVEGMAGND